MSYQSGKTFGESLGRMIGMVLLAALIGALLYAILSGVWLPLAVIVVAFGLVGAILKVAGWGLR